jgi:hypothetical protein
MHLSRWFRLRAAERARVKILYLNSPIYDYLTATLIEGLTELGHDVVCTETSNYGVGVTEAEFMAKADSADLIVVGSNVGIREHLLQRISNPRIVLVDGSDFAAYDINSATRYKAVFKRELCIKERDARDKFIFPLPLAAERRYFLQPATKDILVSFIANMQTNPLRNSIHVRLKNTNNPAIISGSTSERAYSSIAPNPNPIETPNFHKLLARSLISVNVPGAGYDCARFWEILAARAMLFTFAPDIVIPDGFTDGVDFVTFSSFDEFESKLSFYLETPERAVTIAERGYRRLIEHHTTGRRAAYFLEHALTAVRRSGYCAQGETSSLRDPAGGGPAFGLY